ncbi:FAD-dependent oxidoreductase [Sphingomonas sp. PB2P19]|uniref:NAD(P)/FAD-dependent oxidoreductase n=1 Tax=Sphingomonas rhamnosi TaxID=3096156 RepID=UPI002FC74068
MKIAIIGAGIAGLSCAEALQRQGHDIAMFDKGRGAGGRMATRRAETPIGEVAFDHGAQYFTARDPAFAAAVREWEVADVVAPWPSAGEAAWVGTPGMSSVVGTMAQSLPVRWNAPVHAIRRVGPCWVVDPVSDTLFDAVVVATPAEQAAPLLIAHDPAMAAMAQACPSAPCWTAMLAFDQRLPLAADVVRDAGILSWAARNNVKPGRGEVEAWVLQATPDWSREHLEDDSDAVVATLLSALGRVAGAALPDPIVRIGHRWRYARATATRHGALWNGKTRIGAVGDWLLAPRVESAWRSGRMLAERIGAQTI